MTGQKGPVNWQNAFLALLAIFVGFLSWVGNNIHADIEKISTLLGDKETGPVALKGRIDGQDNRITRNERDIEALWRSRRRASTESPLSPRYRFTGRDAVPDLTARPD